MAISTLSLRCNGASVSESFFSKSGLIVSKSQPASSVICEVSLNNVAQAAGVTRGAIYWHFKNKTDLFDAVCQRVKTPIGQLVEEVADEKTANPLEQLLIKGADFRRSVVENAALRKVMTIIYHRCEITDDKDPILLYQRGWLIHGRESSKRMLSNAMAKNQLPKDLDLRLAAILLHSIFNGMMNSWLLMPESFDLVEDANRILRATFENLRNNTALRINAAT